MKVSTTKHLKGPNIITSEKSLTFYQNSYVWETEFHSYLMEIFRKLSFIGDEPLARDWKIKLNSILVNFLDLLGLLHSCYICVFTWVCSFYLGFFHQGINLLCFNKL